MRRLLSRLLAIVILLLLAYLASALVLNQMTRPAMETGDPSYTFFACDNGVHVDIVLPVRSGDRDWRDFFPPTDFSGDIAAAEYLSLGWGAEAFFATTPRWQDIRPGPVLLALFWLDRSVLHVAYHGDPGEVPECRRLATDSAGQARLFAFIDDSIEGRPRRVLPGYGANDAFYAATGRYSLFRTCNVWSADALHAAGLPTGRWSPFSFQIMSRLSQAPAD